MTARVYPSPEAFRQALEQRLRSAARTSHADIGRLRQVLVFDRFLARVFAELGERAVVKGGVVLELRLERARTTRDVDLRVVGDSSQLLQHLERAGNLDLKDYLNFRLEPDRHHPTLEGDGLVYDGKRFRAEATLAGKRYGDVFGLDVGFGDIMTSPAEIVEGSDFLSFAGISRARHRVYPREVHISEKLHAYTLPRPRENSRVKDLPDLALLGTTGTFEAKALRAAMDATFSFRKTHPLPTSVPKPPDGWTPVYERMATLDGLPWSSMAALIHAVQEFLDPVLSGQRGQWDPQVWAWT